MKTETVIKKLGNFKEVQNKGARYFYSRKANHGNRLVKVIDQGNGKCVALPITQGEDGVEKVAFHAKTVKALVNWLTEEV